jgi:prepilin-type N-terminal cleavage/methylation domain-containing protein
MVPMQRRTSGFTLIELLIVIMIGSVLAGITFSGVQGVQTRLAVQGARTMYSTIHSKARSQAIEMGQTVIIQTIPSTDVVRTWKPYGTSIAVDETWNFRTEMDVDIRGNSFYMCLTPRGYADRDCGSLREHANYVGTSAAQRVQFWLGTDSTSVLVMPMGQLVR